MPTITTRSRAAVLTLAVILASSISSPVWAGIDSTGDVLPADPSTWTNLTTGYIGNTSIGTLTVNGSSKLQSGAGYLGFAIGSSGTITVDGLNATWNSASIFVGASGAGVMDILNGAWVTSSGPSIVGSDNGSTGIVVVDGISSRWFSAVTIGLLGAGTLSITRGGNVNSGVIGNLGGSFGGTGLAVVDGSAFSNGGTLTIGSAGSGTLSLSNRGTVTTAMVYLGASLGGTGVALVDGTGSKWTNTGGMFIGNSGSGTLSITRGGSVSSNSATYVGANAGGSGIVTVDGTGSTWNATHLLYVGNSGNGSLNISNGGSVNLGTCYLGYNKGAMGTTMVAGFSSYLTGFGGNLYLGYSGSGSLGISKSGYVYYVAGYLGFNLGGTGTLTVDGTLSTWSSQVLYVGYSGSGFLGVSNHGMVSDTHCYLGYSSGGTGVVTVDGAGTGTGSTWTNSGNLYVGYSGSGSLRVINGGKVSSSLGYLGSSSSATGAVTIDGAGSAWTNSGSLYLGYSGAGTLNITNGGIVTAGVTSINDQSLLTMMVGDGSIFSGSTGNMTSLTNSGTIRLKAVPGLAAGTYTPIGATTWAGTGTVQTLGGTWNSANHTFIASSAATGNGGTPIAIDLSQTQQIIVTDPSSATSAVTGFQAAATASTLTLTAARFAGSQSALLQSALAAGNAVLTGWNFTTSGYTPGSAVALSLQIGTGYSSQNMSIWQFDGTVWSPLAAPDLTYNGTHASFVVTSLTTYAVSSPLIPTTLSSTTLLTSHNMLPKITDLTLASTLNLNGFNQQLNSLTGTSPALLTNTSATPSTLTVSPVASGISPSTPASSTFAGTLAGNLALIKSGGGTFVLAGTTSYTGATTVASGTLAFAPTAGARNTPAVLIQASGASVAPGASLDLSNHDMLIHSGSPAQVEALISSAYFFGLWNKAGITSSSAQANAITTLGIMSGADYNVFSPTPGVFDGVAVANGDTVIKYTYAGDINLDGVVNDDDFGLFSGAYFFTGTGNYARGDLNFDGLVNDDDFGLFSGNYFFTPSGVLGEGWVVGGGEGGAVPVPEPGSLMVLGLGVMVLVRRRF